MPATMTLKHIPDDVYARLKISADTHRRAERRLVRKRNPT